MKTIQYDPTTHKLVPLEPTDAMLDAALGGAIIQHNMLTIARRGLVRNYTAMLAAAPAITEQPEGAAPPASPYAEPSAVQYLRNVAPDILLALRNCDREPLAQLLESALRRFRTEAAQEVKCWSCRKPYTLEQRADADGNCPHCGVEIDITGDPSEWLWQPTEARTLAEAQQLVETLVGMTVSP